MWEDIPWLVRIAVVMFVARLSLRRLDGLLREGKAVRDRGYRPPPGVYDHREPGEGMLRWLP